MSSRVDEIKARHYAITLTDGREICFQCVDELRPGFVADWPCDIAHLLAERDTLASRLAATEARIAEIRDGSQAYRYWRTNNDVLMYSCRFCPSPIEAVGVDGDHRHHRICALNPDYEAGMQAIRNERADGGKDG